MKSLRGDPNLVEGLLSSRLSGNVLLANIVDDDVRCDMSRTAVLGDVGGGSIRTMAELEKAAARSITPHAATIVRSMKQLLGIIVVDCTNPGRLWEESGGIEVKRCVGDV